MAAAFVLLTAGTSARSLSARARASFDHAIANDNRTPAGALANGVLTVALELRSSTWMPDGDSGIALPIAAFAEAGKAPSIPGPLLRVASGTRVHVSVRNRLEVRAVVHGLRDHDGTVDSLVLAPGESREVDFIARAVGTHFYFARTTPAPTILSRGADSQLAGALIVDPPGSDETPSALGDRVLVITAWEDTARDSTLRYGRDQIFAINGASWPHTEHLQYTVGDTVRWRVINASLHGHPMHLHGFYFSVMSHGTPFEDTVYDAARRRNAVTESMVLATTMSIQWIADRSGNWLYHCHFINHVDTQLRLASSPHPALTAMTSSTHFTDAMAGLVMAVAVRDTARTTVARARAPRRTLRLFVDERAAPMGALPSYAYVLQQGAHEPAHDSMQQPGSTLMLHQGEPTRITVINRTRHPTSVHWHGMELESYYDGVAGWSGADALTAPMIAPGDSFVAEMTPPRSGTFIYHTHADDLAQLTGGLYGALLVLPPHSRPNPNDRVIVFSDSSAANMHDTPPSLVNGASVPAPITLCANTPHRLRMVGISAVSGRRLRLLDDTTVVQWKPLAKDGQELPAAQQLTSPAATKVNAGETRDVEFTPPHLGEYVLEVTSLYNVPRVTRVPLISRSCTSRGAARSKLSRSGG
jgi:FtsP/CotA-like multicopper oxidase with cupredoxin domain